MLSFDDKTNFCFLWVWFAMCGVSQFLGIVSGFQGAFSCLSGMYLLQITNHCPTHIFIRICVFLPVRRLWYYVIWLNIYIYIYIMYLYLFIYIIYQGELCTVYWHTCLVSMSSWFFLAYFTFYFNGSLASIIATRRGRHAFGQSLSAPGFVMGFPSISWRVFGVQGGCSGKCGRHLLVECFSIFSRNFR